MASALQNASRLDTVSEEEMERAKEYYVDREANDLIKSDISGVFLEMNGDEAKVLHTLMTGSLLDLALLQTTFRERIMHEARALALRSWEETEKAFAVRRIQDGRCE